MEGRHPGGARRSGAPVLGGVPTWGGAPAWGGASAWGGARGLRTWAAARHGEGDAAADAGKKKIKVTFVEADGETTHTVDAVVGKNMLQVAHEHDVELEGACECSLACSTCHVILDRDVYDSLTPPCDDEEDMLDLAFGLTETSRLGCQVVAEERLDGMRLRLPSATRNMAVDGFKPKPH